jgi:peptidoglycan/xylan/chitin deacetylase (PgdA/CDA1 family)
MRKWVKAGAARVLCRVGMDRVYASASGAGGVPVVIAYHRVVEDFASQAKTCIPSLLVSRQMFEQHLDWIGRRYRFVDMNELGKRLESESSWKDPIAAVTFDDGYQDFYDHALPVLQRKGIPAAVFVVTDHVGTTRVQVHDKLYLLLTRRFGRPLGKRCDRLNLAGITAMSPFRAMRALIESLPMATLHLVVEALELEDSLPEDTLKLFNSLSWETLDRIQRSGHTIGSHTRTHVLMANESPGRVLEEAAGSRQEMERRLGATIQHFAYPSGSFNTASVNAVAAAGYRFGFTSCPHRSVEHPLLTVPRTLLWENSSLNSRGSFSGPVLDCQVRHAFDWAGGCRQRHTASREN